MKDSSHIYEYQPFQCLEEEFNNWEEETMNKKEKEGYNWIQNIYWKLDIVSCILVLRNKINKGKGHAIKLGKKKINFKDSQLDY